MRSDIRVKLFGREHPNGPACYPPCKITRDHALITRLYPGERISLEAVLTKSTAAYHAAFAVASTVAVRPRLDHERYERERDDIVGGDLSGRDLADALNHHDHVRRLQLVARDSTGEPVSNRLAIVSECGLSGREIFEESCSVLKGMFLSASFSYQWTRQGETTIRYVVQDKGHTFGSVFQDLVHRDRDALGVSSIGYFQPHPLDPNVVVCVAPSDDAIDPDYLMSRLKSHCVGLLEKLIASLA